MANYPAQLDSLPPMLDAVRQAALSAGFANADIERLTLATEEAIVNIIHYAYKGKKDVGLIKLDCATENKQLCITLTDSGAPFNPLTYELPKTPGRIEDTPIGGLGVMMIRKILPDSTYIREGNTNKLTLIKKCPT